MILLAPPMQHYGYYDSVRSELFDFYAAFHAAAASVGERAVLVANTSPRVNLDEGSWRELAKRGVPGDDLLRGLMDDIWVRDFFPTQLRSDYVARFAFAPAYLSKRDVSYITSSTDRTLDRWDLPGLRRHDDLVLDGGGIVFDPDSALAIVTERVLRDNPRLAGRDGQKGLGPASTCCPADPYGLLVDGGAEDEFGNFTPEELALGAESLANELGLEAVAIIPEEPGVPRLGHADGIVNWLAPDVVALSSFDDAQVYDSYKERILDAFDVPLQRNVTVVPFPYAPTSDTWHDGFESARGVYVNYLKTKHAIYVPMFGLPEDNEALQVATTYGDKPAIAVDAKAVSIMGGSVRCLSQHLWGEPADVVLARASSDTDNPPSSSSLAALPRTSHPFWNHGGIYVATLALVFFLCRHN